MLNDFTLAKISIRKSLFSIKIIVECHRNAIIGCVKNTFSIQNPFIFTNIIGSDLSGMSKYIRKKVFMYGNPISRRKAKCFFSQYCSNPTCYNIRFFRSSFNSFPIVAFLIITTDFIISFTNSDFAFNILFSRFQ